MLLVFFSPTQKQESPRVFIASRELRSPHEEEWLHGWYAVYEHFNRSCCMTDTKYRSPGSDSVQGNSGDNVGHKPYERHIINSFSSWNKERRSIALISAIRTKQTCIFWEGYEKDKHLSYVFEFFFSLKCYFTFHNSEENFWVLSCIISLRLFTIRALLNWKPLFINFTADRKARKSKTEHTH
jgi:hypothetical protein